MGYLSMFLKFFISSFGVVLGGLCAVILALKCIDWICLYLNYRDKM